MRRSDSGEGYAKAILALGILAALIYVGIEAVPVYVNNYQLADYLRDRAVKATVERPTAENLQAEVVTYARNLGLPVTSDNVQVTVTRDSVKIQLDYTVPVDLKVYTWVLHFTPSAESRAL